VSEVELRVEGYPPCRVPAGITLLEACEAIEVPMESACGGFACCNSCRVDVLDGMDRLSPRLDEEDAFLDTDRQRLGCQATLLAGDGVAGVVSVRLAPGA
jgi:ferredoxin